MRSAAVQVSQDEVSLKSAGKGPEQPSQSSDPVPA
eukprot:CAMPEP_0171751144 /NCGR_PEP_ID=MMETSP0991-20121206/41839_1 /TAXON_ID=483369 /ORGANISM="non described non described, Strain CCMP2098" /LENGTH=34 /DNA_ID= /DNA_START= /DNA_END= /DNA_ORIENTATION=